MLSVRRGAICFMLVIAAGLALNFAFTETFRVMGFITEVDGKIEQNLPFAAILTMMIVRYLCYFAIVLACAGFKFKKKEAKQMLTDLNLNTKIKPLDILIVTMLSILSLCTFISLQAGLDGFFNVIGWNAGSSADMVPINWGQYLGFLFAVAFLPAVIEEMLFRGLIFNGLREYGKWTAILISALLFSLYHQNPLMTVYQFALGVFFASIVAETKSLVLPMIMHFLNNAIIMSYSFFAGTDAIPFNWNIKSVISGIILALLGIVVIMNTLKLFRRDVKQDFGRNKFTPGRSVGYYMCIGMGAVLWIAILISGFMG